MVPRDMTNGNIRDAIIDLARVMTAQVNMDVEPKVNAFESTMTSRLKDFMRMNPHIFHCYKVLSAIG